MKYIKLFENSSAYSTFKNSANYVEPHLSLVGGEDGEIHLNDPELKYVKMPLSVKVSHSTSWYVTDGEGVSTTPSSLYYRINGGSWTQYSGSVSLSSKDVIQFKGDITISGYGNCYFNIGYVSDIYGNPLSILNSTGYSTMEDFENGQEDFNFIDYQLFSRCDNPFIDNTLWYNTYPNLALPFDYSDYCIPPR